MFERIASFQPRVVGLREPGPGVLEHRPLGKRPRQRARLALGQREPRLVRERLERDRQDFAVRRARIVCLDPGLELVVANQEPVRELDAEELLELTMNAGVPVDERPVAVEGRPPLHAASLVSRP